MVAARRRLYRLFTLLIALGSAWPIAAWAEPVVPDLTGRVVDQAGIITSDNLVLLTQMLEAHEAQSSNQVVVVTLSSLQGLSIEDFGVQLGRHWGIGQADKDNGVLLIVAPNERQVRIEVGYGLEGVLTDALAKIIIEREILPFFKDGDMNQGILAGTRAILGLLAGSYQPSPALAPESDTGYLLYMILGLVVGPWVVVIFFVVRAYRRSIKRLGTAPRNSDRYVLSSSANDNSNNSSSISSDSSSSSSSSDFSGGGGSFGGGGASGRW